MHRIKSKLTALALCFGVLLTLPVTANAAAPSDVSGHWAEKYLTEYVEKGYLKGKGDGLIHPDDTMTRAEFAALMNRVLGFTAESAGVDGYTDADGWYRTDLAKALAAGYMSGSSDATMSPNSVVTRGQAFTMIARAIGLTAADTSALDAFSDGAQVAGYAQNAAAALVEAGVVNGSNGAISPAAPLNRASAVKLLSEAAALGRDVYVYGYAGLTWVEYWSAEDIYLSGTDLGASSDKLDSHDEHDTGAFDAVTRATINHGVHRASFQSIAILRAVDDASGESVSFPIGYWKDGSTIVLTDGTEVGYATNRETRKAVITYTVNGEERTATLDHCEVSGIKYVPVKVATADYEDFIKTYTFVRNGETLAGGYSENKLQSYTGLVAAVDANTNGLKTAVRSGDGWTFSARAVGTGSGLKGAAQATVSADAKFSVVSESTYGDFIRVDVTADYGALGQRIQAVEWVYYGNDATRTNAVATYGTKFAADNWMHKSNGIQLGLTDSLRCQLPAGTDGTGYWTITIYALGYADYTWQFEVTENDLHAAGTPMLDSQKTQLTALRDQAKALLESEAGVKGLADNDLDWTNLKEHYDEAVALLANAAATKAEAAELLDELPDLISAVSA